MRGVVRVSHKAAYLIGLDAVPFTQVSHVPVGSLVTLIHPMGDYPPVIGEIEDKDHEDPGFAAQGVKWIGFPKEEPGNAYEATPPFQELLYKEVFEKSWDWSVLAPGDLAAVTWWHPDPAWYINFLEMGEGFVQEQSLGFPTSPGMYGSLDNADGVLLLSAGRKEWVPARKKGGRRAHS